MFQDAFVKLEGQESDDVLAEINPAITGGNYNPATVTILAHNLSFYPGYKFLDIADYDCVPAFRKFAIYKQGEVIVLDWTNKPIYELNERALSKLDEYSAADYIRFFFKYVRGKHGRFIVAETVDDINWAEEPPPAVRKAIGQLLSPVKTIEADKNGHFKLEACMVYKKSLYKMTLSLTDSGIVSIENEDFLIDDIPALDDTLAL